MTKVAFVALPRSAFTTLQKSVFPIYFQSQSLLILLVAATVPPFGPASMVKEKSDWISLAVMSVTAGLNLLVYGPRTKDVMIERIHQGTTPIAMLLASADVAVATRDVKLELGAGINSDEMKKLDRSFSKAHAMSIHLNLITIGATLWYGWRLSSRLKFETS